MRDHAMLSMSGYDNLSVLLERSLDIDTEIRVQMLDDWDNKWDQNALWGGHLDRWEFAH